MNYASILQDLPPDLQLVMLKLVEAVEQNLRDELAVRRQDFDDLKAAVKELTEAQKRTEQRVEELTEAQKRTEQRVIELAEAQKRTETEIRRLADKQNEMDVKLGRLVGDQLERRYRERAYAYFRRLLRHVQAISLQDLEASLEAHLTPREMDELFLLDLLVSGQVGRQPEARRVLLVMEVSAVVDRKDVERAVYRAGLLRRAGYTAIPTVAGEEVTLGGEEAARAQNAFLVQDGRHQFWQEALAAASGAAPAG
jgi:hypothetical protein